MTPTNDRLLRDAEVAALLGCSKSTIWRQVRNGSLPRPVKIGGMSRFPQSEVDAALAQAKERRGAGS